MEEASELIDLRLYFDNWSSIFIYKANMVFYFCFKINCFVSHLVNEVLLLQNLQKLFSIVQVLQILNSLRDVCLKLFELVQSLIREILRRWLIVLYTLKVAYDLLGICLLFVDDTLEHIELLINLLINLILKTFLVQNLLLHFLALSQVIRAFLLYLLKFLNVLTRRLFKSKCLSPLSRVFKIAIIA